MTDSPTPQVVHVLSCGHALCGKPGAPGEWDDGHRWIRIEDASGGATTCAGCFLALVRPELRDMPPARRAEWVAGKIREAAIELSERFAVELRFLDMQMTVSIGRHPNAAQLVLVMGGPQKPGEIVDAELPDARMAERTDTPTATRADGHLLTPEQERELLVSVFAWREQGSLTRWKTKPSRQLAQLADRLSGAQRPFAEPRPEMSRLRERGRDIAFLEAGARFQALETPRGVVYEIGKVQHEIGRIAADMREIAESCQQWLDTVPRNQQRERFGGEPPAEVEARDTKEEP